jgi:predicted permease
MRSALWRLTEWYLSHHLPPATAAPVLGDLSEDFARYRGERGRVRAGLWLVREAWSLASVYRRQRRLGGPGAWGGLSATLAEQVWRDMRLALRRLRATPLFSAFAVASLALGLGVTTAAYSVVDALLWQPIGIPDAGHLAVVTARPYSSIGWQSAVSEPDFVDLRAAVRTMPSLAASTFEYEALNFGEATEPLECEAVTGNYFETVGVRARLGRTIQPADERPDAEPVLVLAYDFWRVKTGADEGIVGRTVHMGSQPVVVIGVAAEGFHGLQVRFGSNADGWIPLTVRQRLRTVAAGAPVEARRDRPEMTVVGRLTTGEPVERVAAELGSLGSAFDTAVPISQRMVAGGPVVPSGRLWSAEPMVVPIARHWSAETMAAAAQPSTAVTSAGAGIIGLVGLVLVVACTNLANLMLGRGASRQHECAVRRALGASRGRLVREQCAESAILAMLGGAGALLTARVLLHAFTLDLPVSSARVIALEPHLNAASMFAAAVALLAALVVFGLGPALQLTAASLRERLAGEAASQGSVRWRTRRSLIAWQVTISTALIVIAAVSLRVVAAAGLHDPGFDLPHLALGVVDIHSQHWDEARGRRALEAIETAAHAERGFRAVALSSGVPLGLTIRPFCQLSSTDTPLLGPRDGTEAGLMVSTPGIFETLGVPLVRGRGFDNHDTAATTPVIVVSEHVARAIFGTTDVIGRHVLYRGIFTLDTKTVKTLEIVGVARDTDTQVLFDRSLGSAYIPLAQQYEATLVLIGRTPGDPSTMVKAFAAIGRKADPDLPIAFASTGPLMLTGAYVLLRVVAWLSAGLAGLAVVLAMIGLYGVLSHLVARRTREIGIRLALGAEAGRIRWMIVRDGLQPVWAGLVAGIGLGVLARFVLRAIYVGADISPIDPFAFAVAVATLLTAGLVACGLPARRACRVDPNVALREM